MSDPIYQYCQLLYHASCFTTRADQTYFKEFIENETTRVRQTKLVRASPEHALLILSVWNFSYSEGLVNLLNFPALIQIDRNNNCILCFNQDLYSTIKQVYLQRNPGWRSQRPGQPNITVKKILQEIQQAGFLYNQETEEELESFSNYIYERYKGMFLRIECDINIKFELLQEMIKMQTLRWMKYYQLNQIQDQKVQAFFQALKAQSCRGHKARKTEP